MGVGAGLGEGREEGRERGRGRNDEKIKLVNRCVATT